MDAMDVAQDPEEVGLNEIVTRCCRDTTTLKEWQIQAFKRIQKERVIVVSVPTGSGKSLTFTLLSEVLGKCVFVIIPLLSLLTDIYQCFS